MNEDRLFYACVNYCETLNHYKSTEYDIILGGLRKYDDFDKKKLMDFERERLRNSVKRLSECLKDMMVILNE